MIGRTSKRVLNTRFLWPRALLDYYTTICKCNDDDDGDDTAAPKIIAFFCLPAETAGTTRISSHLAFMLLITYNNKEAVQSDNNALKCIK